MYEYVPPPPNYQSSGAPVTNKYTDLNVNRSTVHICNCSLSCFYIIICYKLRNKPHRHSLFCTVLRRWLCICIITRKEVTKILPKKVTLLF